MSQDERWEIDRKIYDTGYETGYKKAISEFLNDLEYARNEFLNHYNYEPNIILIELRKKWEDKSKDD